MLDRYSKAVLTLIAAALVGLFAQNLIRPVFAENPQVVKAVVCDPYDLRRCARVFEDGYQSESTSRNFLHTR